MMLAYEVNAVGPILVIKVFSLELHSKIFEFSSTLPFNKQNGYVVIHAPGRLHLH